MDSSTSSALLKAELRRRALAARAALDDLARCGLRDRLIELAPELVQSRQARAVSAFHPVRDEPDVLPAMSALSSAGVVTALPVTVGRGRRLVFRLWRPGEALRPGEMGILEPLPEAPEVEPDFLFVPLTCFDRRGHRIGFGAGHYDRTLEYLRARRPTFAVGVAFACAEVPEVPIGGHDQALDLIITERETIDCGKV